MGLFEFSLVCAGVVLYALAIASSDARRADHTRTLDHTRTFAQSLQRGTVEKNGHETHFRGFYREHAACVTMHHAEDDPVCTVTLQIPFEVPVAKHQKRASLRIGARDFDRKVWVGDSTPAVALSALDETTRALIMRLCDDGWALSRTHAEWKLWTHPKEGEITRALDEVIALSEHMTKASHNVVENLRHNVRNDRHAGVRLNSLRELHTRQDLDAATIEHALNDESALIAVIAAKKKRDCARLRAIALSDREEAGTAALYELMHFAPHDPSLLPALLLVVGEHEEEWQDLVIDAVRKSEDVSHLHLLQLGLQKASRRARARADAMAEQLRARVRATGVDNGQVSLADRSDAGAVTTTKT